jgi:hypothetical protein
MADAGMAYIVCMLRCLFLSCLIASAALAQNHDLGYDNTPTYPGMKWRVHDVNRPHPEVVTPGTCNAPSPRVPSDAEVLFDGKDTSKWNPLSWKVENGYMEVVPRKGGAVTKESFGDIQLHVEWASPAKVEGTSQNRGNSGIMLMGKYEVQVLDSFENPTYADGQAAAVYGQYTPLVNASCKPGEWQFYDIIFEAPKFDGTKLVKPAFVTVMHNGVIVENHEQILGTTPHAQVGNYNTPHGDLPLELQNHNTPVRYRNIWVRRLKPRV